MHIFSESHKIIAQFIILDVQALVSNLTDIRQKFTIKTRKNKLAIGKKAKNKSAKDLKAKSKKAKYKKAKYKLAKDKSAKVQKNKGIKSKRLFSNGIQESKKTV